MRLRSVALTLLALSAAGASWAVAFAPPGSPRAAPAAGWRRIELPGSASYAYRYLPASARAAALAGEEPRPRS